MPPKIEVGDVVAVKNWTTRIKFKVTRRSKNTGSLTIVCVEKRGVYNLGDKVCAMPFELEHYL